jgi:hypothetical protein
MMKKRLKTILIAVLLVALGAGVGAYAASTYGTQSDPLVAKSYLDNTLTPKLRNEFQAKVDQQAQVLENKIASSNKTMNFTAVSLSSGQTLRCSAGCEVVLRSGSATAAGALSDVTAGADISSGGALAANHLCVAADSTTVTAGSAVSLLVRGVYTIS